LSKTASVEAWKMTQSLKSVNVITLFVEDPLRSKEFYERIFDVGGVEEGHGTVIFPFDNMFLRLLQRGEAEREMLGQVSVADPRSGTAVQLGFAVDDADAFCAELLELGVPIVYGPVDRPWGRRNAAFVDPDGHVWQFGSDIPED
jgi:catechol 2,3-dioxygenase-like lactoylglutathione lyase family enzyme